jgi:hypothetical protein
VSRINQDSETQKERPSYVYIEGDTGAKITVRKSALLFYGLEAPATPLHLRFAPLPENTLEKYGWYPKHEAMLNWIYYRRLNTDGRNIAEDCVIAAYISVKNMDLSDAFGKDGKYRIGVDTHDLAESLEARIDFAKGLVEKSVGKEQINLKRKIKILETKKHITFKTLIEAGWTHVVLATGWRELLGKGKFVDRLDINLDFFDFFYPKEAFPIGLPGETWIGRDQIIWQAFPKGEIVQSANKAGWILPNRYELKMRKFDSNNFPNLRITFNHASQDVWSQKSDRATKLMSPEGWPTIKEVVEENEKNLGLNYKGKDAEDARRKAQMWVQKFLAMAERYRKRGKKRIAEKNEKAARRLRIAIKKNYEKEQEELISGEGTTGQPTGEAEGQGQSGSEEGTTGQPTGEAEGQGQSGSGEGTTGRPAWTGRGQGQSGSGGKSKKREHLTESTREALNYLGMTQLVGIDPGKFHEKRMGELAEAYDEYLKEIVEELKDLSPDDPRLIDKITELMGTEAERQWTQSESNTTFEKGRATAREKFKPRIKHELRVIQTFPPDDPRVIEHTREIIDSQADMMYLGGEFAYNDEWREVNTALLKNRYETNPVLDDNLKFLIDIQLKALSTPLPKTLQNDPNIRAYVEQEHNWIKRNAEIKKQIEEKLDEEVEKLVKAIKEERYGGVSIR